MVYHLFYNILSLVLYVTGDSVNFLAKPFGDIFFGIFVAPFFCFVNMALYICQFSPQQHFLLFYNMERCMAELCNFSQLCKFCLLVVKHHYSIVKVLIKSLADNLLVEIQAKLYFFLHN